MALSNSIHIPEATAERVLESLANNSMQQTALHIATDAEHWNSIWKYQQREQ